MTLLSRNLCPFLIVGEIPIFSKVILMLPGKFSHLFSLVPSISIHFVSVFGWLTLFHNFRIGLPHSFPKLSIFSTCFFNFPQFSPCFSQELRCPKNGPPNRSPQAARLGRAGTVELLLDSQKDRGIVDARCGHREQCLGADK